MKIVSSDRGKACSGVTCFDWQVSKWPMIVTNSSLISFLHEKGNLFELCLCFNMEEFTGTGNSHQGAVIKRF